MLVLILLCHILLDPAAILNVLIPFLLESHLPFSRLLHQITGHLRLGLPLELLGDFLVHFELREPR